MSPTGILKHSTTIRVFFRGRPAALFSSKCIRRYHVNVLCFVSSCCFHRSRRAENKDLLGSRSFNISDKSFRLLFRCFQLRTVEETTSGPYPFPAFVPYLLFLSRSQIPLGDLVVMPFAQFAVFRMQHSECSAPSSVICILGIPSVISAI